MVDMNEIKPNLLTRIKGFFLLHPVAVAIIMFIFAIMLFGGCEKARADGMENYALDYLDGYMQENFPESYSVYEAHKSEYYSFVTYMVNNVTVCDILPRPNSGISTITEGYASYFEAFNRGVGASYNNNPYRLAVYTSDILTDITVPCYAYRFVRNSSAIGVGQFPISVSSTMNHYLYQGYHWYFGSRGRDSNPYTMLYTFGTYTITSSPRTVSNVIGYAPDGTDVYCNFTKVTNFIPSYTEDSRLKFAIIDDTSNGKTLMTDIRDFIRDFPIHDTSHSSVYLDPEKIVLGYTVDGVARTITLDSNNSSIRSKYIFETPLSAFDYSESDDIVSITTCDFTIVGTAQGDPDLTSQSYKVSCDYPIKRVSNSIDKGNNQYANDVNGDITSPEVSQSLNYLITFREGYGFDFDEFSDIEFPDYYTYADVYLYNNQAAYNYLINNLFNPNSVAYIIQNIANDEDEVITQIGLFLDDSNYGQYYDVIVFDWIQESSSSITHTYYYFETVSGRNKATTQIVRILQEDVNNIKVNSAAIFTAVDNLENESLEYFNAKLDIDEDILGWLRTIDYSINGINIPEPDYSDITSRLNYIMDKLSIIANHSSEPSEDDTVSEAIAYYKLHSLNDFPIQSVFDDNKLSIWMAGKVHSWLQGTDAQTTKTSLLNDAFDTLKSLYDSLTNEVDFFGNMEKYLLALRGGQIMDLDGKYFSRFFMNTFDPDTYDGGSL